MKIIITENQYKKLLEQQLDLFDDEEEELPISDESDEEEEEVIPIITYSNASHGPKFSKVYFNDAIGDIPTSGKVKLVNVRKPNSKRETEDDIIIDADKVGICKNSRFEAYCVEDYHPEVRGVKSFDDTYVKVISTIGPDIIKSKFQAVVFKSLKDIYGSDSNTWLNDKTRGPGGLGGVINIYTTGDFLLGKKLINTNGDGGEWSILNYFDTNPGVRESIMRMYSKPINSMEKPINSMEELDEFCNWVYKNRVELFTEGPKLKKFVKLNFGSFHNGFLNEDKAYKYVSDLISSNNNLSMSEINLPGSSLDRSGVDFAVTNKTKIKDKDRGVRKFQAKPLDGLSNDGNVYTINSWNVNDVEKKPVEYFIFTSHKKEGVVIFKNIKGSVKSTSKTVVFNYPPISPEELLKEL
jgi:hypothetical protein